MDNLRLDIVVLADRYVLHGKSDCKVPREIYQSRYLVLISVAGVVIKLIHGRITSISAVLILKLSINSR